MELALPFLISALVAGTVFLFFYSLKSRSAKQNLPPEVAGGWPLLGHLNLMSGAQPHVDLGNLADKYGPIFSLRLGLKRGLIVNSWEVAKECFTVNDAVFSNRPKTTNIKHMGYNFAMFAFSPDGHYWREMRKICILKLLSSKRVSMFSKTWDFEVKTLIKSLYDSCAQKKNNVEPAEMRKSFGELTLNVMVRLIAGDIGRKDGFEGNKWHKVIKEFFVMLGVLTLSDVLPFLKWFDFGGSVKGMKRTAKEMDSMLQTWLDEHKSQRSSGHQDFMDELLSIANSVSQEFPRYDPDTINKATCQSMMLGGTDSLRATLVWAISLLLNNEEKLKNAHDELDRIVGRERHVQESDLVNLVYIQSIIKETLRLFPPGPLVVRESVEDCMLAGYHIPAGTILFVNLWKIQLDTSVWDNPHEFQPERFMTTHKDVDVKGEHFKLVPFGFGRRICPGINFSLSVMQFALASLLHAFDIEKPSDEPIDMTGTPGTTNLKATPLEVLLMPRLTPELYE